MPAPDPAGSLRAWHLRALHQGRAHEFTALENVVEDVIDIVAQLQRGVSAPRGTTTRAGRCVCAPKACVVTAAD